MAPPNTEAWFTAVDQGDTATIRAAIGECASLRDENGETALMRAVRNDNYDVVKILLHSGSGLTNSDGYTALMIAAIVNKARCCRALVAKESHLILPDGRTPLMLAAQHDSIDAARALMPYYVTKVDNRGRTALMYAAERGNLPIVEILHARECKFSSLEHETALSIAIVRQHHDVVEFLRSSEEDTMAMLSESARLSMSRRTDLEASLAPSNLLNHSTASQDSSTSDLIMSQADLSERLETTKAIALSELNTMNLELKTRIGKLHEDASELMSRNANLQTENKRLHDRIQELLRQNQELKMELDDERKCHQDAVDQVKDLTDMTQTLRELQSNNMLSESQADFGQRYGALELSIAPDPTNALAESLERNDEIAALRMRIAALSAHDSSEVSDKLSKEIEEKDKIIDDLKKQLSEQINAYNTLNTVVEELREQLSLANTKLSSLDEAQERPEQLLHVTEDHGSHVPVAPSVRIHELESQLQAQSSDTDKFLWTEERENLAGLLTTLSAEKDNLQEENDLLRDRVQMLEAEVEVREQEAKELHHQIHDQKSKLRELAEELDECKALNEDLQKSVNGEPAGDEGRIAALESRNNELRSELVAREADIDLLRNELDTQAGMIRERISSLEGDNAELRKRASHIEDAKNAYEQELEELREASLRIDADRAEHEEEVALLEAEVKNLHAMSKVQAREIRALQRELGDLTCTNNDLRASISGVPSGDDARVYALEERLSALQKEAAFKDQEIAELQRTAGELGDSAFLLERTRDEAAAHEKEAAKLRDRLAARDQDVRDLEKECAEARARIRALEETPLVDSQIQDLTAELEARTNEIDELRRLADDATNKKSDANIDKLLEDLARTTTERDNLQNEVSTLGKTINDLEQSLNATRAQMLESDANVSKLNDEISFLKDQLSTKCSELEEANSKIDSLKAEMEEKTVESASSNPDISSVPSLARSTSKSTQDLDELSIDELRELVDSERRRIKKLNNKITALMTEKNILNDQINAMKTSSARNLPPPAAPVVAETSSALVVSTDDVRIADLEQALKDANERADEKERELSDALQRIENLAMQITSLETEISSLQDRLSSANEAVNKLRNESQQMNEQLTDDAQHKEIVASLTKELEDLKQKNSQLNAVKDDLKRQLEDKVKEIEHQQTEILNLSRVPDKVIDECSDHEIEEPRSVNRSDDIMAHADRCVHFVAGMCVGASMMFGTQFLQNIVH